VLVFKQSYGISQKVYAVPLTLRKLCELTLMRVVFQSPLLVFDGGECS
jgi:hypothetical protein